MKKSAALLAALGSLVVASPLRAQLTDVNPSYHASPYFADGSADSIVSYDWGNDGNVYYQTSTSSFTFGGLYAYSGSSSTQVVAGSADYSGASVVSIGQYIYYNTSTASGTENIYKYGAVGSGPTNALASTATNYGLYANGGRLFITGAPNGSANQIYDITPGASGSLGTPISLGTQTGASGPLAFDGAGDLYYAPGYGDQSIYRWTGTQVANAMANPSVAADQLTVTGHLWLNYSSTYGSSAGGTSMLIDSNGNLLLTVTNFGSASSLAKFGVAGDGSYNGQTSTLFSDANGSLGELRLHNGALYLSDGNEVFSIVPEPSTMWLTAAGVGAMTVFVWRRRVVA